MKPSRGHLGELGGQLVSDEEQVDLGTAGGEPGEGDEGVRRETRRARVTEDQAIKWVTINAAWALGLEDRVGSLEQGKNADVVLWSGNPFSVYSRPEKVWIDGAVLFDRLDPNQQWRTDFELGYVPRRELR